MNLMEKSLTLHRNGSEIAMKLKDIFDRVKGNDTKVFHLMFLLTVLWMLPGLFPLVSYEGDATSICYGSEFTAANGWHTLGQEGYGFWMQPLIYVVLVFFRVAFGAPCEATYCIFSSCCAIALIYATVIFCARLTGLRKSLLLLAVLLIPESYALAMYPNSTAPAALLAVVGFIFLQRGRFVPATALLCIAPLFRLDAALIYCVVPFLVYLNSGSIRRTLKITALAALAVCTFVFASYALIGASVGTTFNEFMDWNGRITRVVHYTAIMGFYGLITLILMPVGIIGLIKSGNKVLILMVVTAVLIIHIFYFSFGNTPKHYALLIPYVAVINGYGLKYLEHKKILRCVYCLAIVALSLFGVYVFQGSTYWKSGTIIDDYVPKKQLFKITTSALPIVYTADFYLGPGRIIITPDEMYTLGGYLYYPYTIRKIKQKLVENIATLKNEALSLDAPNFLAVYWEEYARTKLEMQTSAAKKKIVYYEGCNFVVNGEKFEQSVNDLVQFLDSCSQVNESVVIYLSSPLSIDYDMVLDEVHKQVGGLVEVKPRVHVLNPGAHK